MSDPRLAAIMQAIRAELTVQNVFTVARLDVAALAQTILRAIDGPQVVPEPAPSAFLLPEVWRASWVELGRGVVRCDAKAIERRVAATVAALEAEPAIAMHDPNDPARQRKARLLDQPTGNEPFRPSREPLKNPTLLSKSNTLSINLHRDADPRVLVTMHTSSVHFKVGDVVRCYFDSRWGDWRVRSIDRDTDTTSDIVLGPVG